ncbi:TFIIE alpha subunit-domain-containing protein [Cyathus striatus]|nr:TFIIE alpha subunit-domain-containing protein [Cyathus striatus]
MASVEDKETLRLLVQHVGRAFYESRYTIILDQLARHAVLKDDDLAGRMGLQPKELNKIIAKLSNDCLVKVYRQNELKEGAQRSVGKQYYYIDYEHFCNVVKWRIAKMRHIIDSSLRNELDNKGYICPQCKQSYTPLDVDKLMDFSRGVLLCEICHGEVVDNENAESVQGSKDRMQRFNHQMRFIREGLQKSEAMMLPAFDVVAWVKTHAMDNDKQKTTTTAGGLKVAGADGSRTEDKGIGIMMALDKDESTRRQERDAQAEAKRQQNALPAWHLKSTITGDLTALGVKENAREQAMGSVNGTTSNDDILKGLGVIGGSGVKARLPSTISMRTNGDSEDVKLNTNQDLDYYDQYYASLAASAQGSAQATPTALSAPGSSDFSGTPLPDEEEEDKKPNVEYLDSLNDYRKRSRSQEDVGVNGPSKLPKVVNGDISSLDVNDRVPLDVNGSMNGFGHVGDVGEESGVPQPSDDNPVVYVAGNPKPYSEVTEEDHEQMTPDEYTAYFEVMQARGGY